LRAIGSPDDAVKAASAWHRLTSACHLHAYEMQSPLAEIEHLCAVVASLLPTPWRSRVHFECASYHPHTARRCGPSPP